MKRIVSIFITVVMVLSMLNISTVQAEESWMWPTVKGAKVTSEYGPRGKKFHKGIDIGGNHGKTPVYASKSGKVVLSYDECIGCKSDYGKKGYGENCRHNQSCGNYVIIDHGSGVYSRYLHLHWNSVAKKGTTVKQGDIIGYMGSTGSSTGTHLHFDIWTGGTGASGGTVLDGKTINTNTSQISYIYKGGGHTHSYTYKTESSHPHAEYRECSCGEREYTGEQVNNSSCKSCYPLGSVSFKREVKKTDKTVTFYRNDVVNATSYSISYTVGSSTKNVTMTGRTLELENLSSGSYSAKLIVKNSSTGEEKIVNCDGFSILNTYDVNYDANGGTNAPSSQEKIQGQYITITSETPNRKGYKFLGWSPRKSAVTPSYYSGDHYEKNADIKLYAVWEPETYSIQFDANGGEGELADIVITYGDIIKLPNNVVKDGYYLRGWASDKSAQTPQYVLGKDYKFESNVTLYAVWAESTWGKEVASSFAGGDGTEANPYQISNASELAYLAKIVNSQTVAPEIKYYILTDNINLGYEEWTPIGVYDNSNQYFKGDFNGNGYAISGLYISSSNFSYYGLFGNVREGSKIYNLTLTGDVEEITTTTETYLGGLAGYVENSKIKDITVALFDISNITISDGYIGSVVGELYATAGLAAASVDGCKVRNSTISTNDECSGTIYIGGICGDVRGYIDDCSIENDDILFGKLGSSSTIKTGGIAGAAVTINNCSVKASRFTNKQTLECTVYAGGIVGDAAGGINNCSVTFTDKETISFDSKTVPYSMYLTAKYGAIGGIVGAGEEIYNSKYDGASLILITTKRNASGIYGAGGIIGRGTVNGSGTGSIVTNCISSVNGIIYCKGNAMVIASGGIGGATYSSSYIVKNSLAMAQYVKAVNTNSDPAEYGYNNVSAGDICGWNLEEASKVYTNLDLDENVEAVGTYSTKAVNDDGTSRSDSKIVSESFQKSLLGLVEYDSLTHLETDSTAVWVMEDGQLPELYFNCLNEITVSDNIENGAVTIDKANAVDGEIVTVTATPAEGYILNKIYANGEEVTGSTFVVSGDSIIYATFNPEIQIYDVSITANDNATGTLTNVDEEAVMMSLFATSDGSSITAEDGTEIGVNAEAAVDYAVEAIYINGEEIVGNNFILTKDTEVSVDVTNISTEITAVTNDAENVSDYSVELSGTVSGDGDGISRYIRYWSADDTDTVYTTEIENGEGDYSTTLFTLEAETTYYYQMTEYGEIKSFTTESSSDEELGTDSGSETESPISITDISVKTMGEYLLVDVTAKNANDYATVYVASYDDNKKLSTIQPVELTDGVGQLILPLGNIKTVKAFAWWIDAAYPLCVNKEYVIQ